ncbi:hypothetical protein ENTCAN_09141 [Enterobacter cancerogenus ATCC 35316]|nr:hypothetical protein ENTCAN_09141 [Enterobacter cancerogenus ATCC 35316]
MLSALHDLLSVGRWPAKRVPPITPVNDINSHICDIKHISLPTPFCWQLITRRRSQSQNFTLKK